MKFILTDVSDLIGLITINRPEAMNAMNSEVIKELDQAVSELVDNEEVGVIIITGSGEKAFVAGADINREAGGRG